MIRAVALGIFFVISSVLAAPVAPFVVRAMTTPVANAVTSFYEGCGQPCQGHDDGGDFGPARSTTPLPVCIGNRIRVGRVCVRVGPLPTPRKPR